MEPAVNKPSDKGTNETTKINPVNIKLQDKIVFPKTFSKIVYVRRVTKDDGKAKDRLPGQNLDDHSDKIGSGFQGSSVLRGLTFVEEKRFLENIIGISSQSQDWEKKTKEYWSNISKNVPAGTGLELEVGLRYDKQEDYDYDQNLELNNNGIIIECKGTPINISDYILWRYCLVYSRVANTPEDKNKSPKIDFYLFSKDKEIHDKKINLNTKRKANQLYYKNIADRNWVNFMITVLVAKDKSPTRKTVAEVSNMSDDEKDILLDQYVSENPELFMIIGEDKNLEVKSFVELCVASGKLTRIPNTDTITMEGNTLGNSISEVVSYLLNPKYAETYQTLKAQLKHTL
jgi:hypothetical protein